MHPIAALRIFGRDPSLWVAVLAPVLAFALLVAPTIPHRVYTDGDLGDFYMPLKLFYSEQLQQAEPFDWCPEICCGCYLQGEGQVSMYHPFMLLLYKWLPFTVAYNVDVLLRYPFLLLGMFFFLRRWHLPRASAFFGGTCFTFSGFNLLHFAHLPAIWIVAHIPWLLLSIDFVMRSSDGRCVRRAWLAIALLTTSELLFGYPQYVFLSLVTEMAYVVLLLVLDGFRVRPVLAICAGKLLALLAGSVQLLPTTVALAHSIRADPSAEFLTSYSLHPWNLVQLLSPYFFSDRYYVPPTLVGNLTELGVFNGTVATVLSVWAVCRWKKSTRWRALTMGSTVLGLLALVLALGRYGYLYRLQILLPVVGIFRVPSRYIMIVHLAMSVLVAIASADLLRSSRKRKGIVSLTCVRLRDEHALLGMVVASIVICLLGLALRTSWPTVGNESIGPASLLILGAGLVVAAALLTLLAQQGRRWAWPLLVVLSIVDQTAFGLWTYKTFPPETMDRYLEKVPTPPTAGHRAYLKWNDGLTALHMENAGGLLALFPRTVLNYNKIPSLRAAGAGWYFYPTGAYLGHVGKWVPIANPLPYARLVSHTIRTLDPNKEMPKLDLAQTATVDEDIELPPGQAGEARVLFKKAGSLSIESESEAKRLLVVAESFHPGWRAQLDQNPTTILRVYGDFMGVVVPVGKHRVEFSFRPDSLRQGKRLSALGLVLIGVGFWVVGRWVVGGVRPLAS